MNEKVVVGYLQPLYVITSSDGFTWVLSDKDDAVSLAKQYGGCRVQEALLNQIIGSAKHVN